MAICSKSVRNLCAVHPRASVFQGLQRHNRRVGVWLQSRGATKLWLASRVRSITTLSRTREYMLFVSIEKHKLSAHPGFPCKQVRWGLWLPLIFHFEWFPHYLLSSSRGVWPRRPGKSRSWPRPTLWSLCRCPVRGFHVPIMQSFDFLLWQVKLKSNIKCHFAMKVLEKKPIFNNGHREHVLREGRILMEAHSPFIIRCPLFNSYRFIVVWFTLLLIQISLTVFRRSQAT